jgi:hypothetical protein
MMRQMEPLLQHYLLHQKPPPPRWVSSMLTAGTLANDGGTLSLPPSPHQPLRSGRRAAAAGAVVLIASRIVDGAAAAVIGWGTRTNTRGT